MEQSYVTVSRCILTEYVDVRGRRVDGRVVGCHDAVDGTVDVSAVVEACRRAERELRQVVSQQLDAAADQRTCRPPAHHHRAEVQRRPARRRDAAVESHRVTHRHVHGRRLQVCHHHHTTRVTYWSTVHSTRTGSNHAAGSCVHRDSRCDIQPWARDAHHYCSA